MAQEVIVLVTCPAHGAERIARPLVEERLAACVNVVSGITSIFRWDGDVCTESEDLLVIKSNEHAWEALEKRVAELHTYDTPEIVCLKIEDGHKPYLDWLNSSVRLQKPRSGAAQRRRRTSEPPEQSMDAESHEMRRSSRRSRSPTRKRGGK